MKKVLKCILSVLLIVTVFILLVLCLNPLRRTENQIKKYILSTIPLGTKMEEVIKKVEDNPKWMLVSMSCEHGYRIDKNNKIGTSRDVMIGDSHIRVHIGSYRSVFITDVSVYFAFNENQELVDITIRKETDSL